MTIVEAMEYLKQIGKDYCFLDAHTGALQLGIEALERLKELRRMKYVTDFSLLPSETEGEK